MASSFENLGLGQLGADRNVGLGGKGDTNAFWQLLGTVMDKVAPGTGVAKTLMGQGASNPNTSAPVAPYGQGLTQPTLTPGLSIPSNGFPQGSYEGLQRPKDYSIDPNTFSQVGGVPKVFPNFSLNQNQQTSSISPALDLWSNHVLGGQ